MAQSPFGGIKLFNMGEPGTGKTSVLKSIMDAGIDCFGIFTEPGMSVIAGDPRLKYTYIPPAAIGWAAHEELAERINTLSNKSLQDSTFGRDEHRQFFKVLSACNNFKDDRTGKEYGSIEKWGTDRCFFFDSLTGLTKMLRGLAVGNKPLMTQPDYGVVMFNIQKFVDDLCNSLHCHLYVTAHIEVERDEITGGTKIMASTMGRKLPPVVHVNFDDALLAERDGDKFTWTVHSTGALVKARHFPLTGKHLQDFTTLLDRWKELGGIIEKEERK